VLFKKAIKSKSKLKLAMFGVAGSGKTYSALSIATGISSKMNNKIAVIDTEFSASKYADRFEFDVIEEKKLTIQKCIDYIIAAESEKYDVLIIDSFSHAWQELLEEVDRIAKVKYHGNSWAAWSEGTPLQKQLRNSILTFQGHLIVAMRSKTEWMHSKDDKGKTKITRVGLTPEQGKNIEYEFDFLVNITQDHFAHVIKDRTGVYQDKIIEKPGKELGVEFFEWLNDGSSVEDIENKRKNNLIKKLNASFKHTGKDAETFSDHIFGCDIDKLKDEQKSYLLKLAEKNKDQLLCIINFSEMENLKGSKLLEKFNAVHKIKNWTLITDEIAEVVNKDYASYISAQNNNDAEKIQPEIANQLPDAHAPFVTDDEVPF